MTATTLMLLTLLFGMLIVIGGILLLKLEPFLALILGALAVGFLTPTNVVQRYALENSRLTVDRTDSPDGSVRVKGNAAQGIRPGAVLSVLQPQTTSETGAKAEAYTEVAELTVENVEQGWATAKFSRETTVDWTDRTLVLTPQSVAAANKQAQLSVPDRIARGFGSTCASIGLLIAMASIVGKCLLDSGAADRIVRSAMRLCGEKGAPLAFLGSGFLLAIPVFFDTVFYLMVPLAKALRLRTGHSYLLYIMAIFAGGTMAHSLVPPTPGPLFVAGALHVDLGLMMLVGLVVGLFTSGMGYLSAVLLSRWVEIPLRDSAEFSLADLTETMERDIRDLPPLWLSLLPILLPVVLIGGLAVLPYLESRLPKLVVDGWNLLGDKNLALILSAAIALAMLVRQKRSSLATLRPAIQSALASAGSIILITAAGGAFGGLLQESGISSAIRSLPSTSTPMVITLAFLVTAAIRTAQGSATVAMITSVGMLESFATSGGLTCHPVYLAIAIGCGSKPVSWMNDSGFWIICRMAGMTESETLRTVTPISGVMGLTGLIVTLIGATLLPLV